MSLWQLLKTVIDKMDVFVNEDAAASKEEAWLSGGPSTLVFKVGHIHTVSSPGRRFVLV